MAVTMKNAIFWDVTSQSLEIYWRCGKNLLPQSSR